MSAPVHLTPMERAVLDLLAQGQSHKGVAKALGIGRGTVGAHLDHVKKKAGIAGPVHRLVVWYLTTFDDGGHNDNGGADV